MNKPLLLMASAALWSLATLATAGGPPHHGGGRHAGPGYPGGAHRPYYPAYRPVYRGSGGAYWGPRAGIYIGGPGYWGGWPYAWNAGYAWPYAAAPLVVHAAPAPQVFIQQEPVAVAPAQPAASYWYYCTQPAGYFPYVQDCGHAWMKVVPQLPGAASTPPSLAP